LPNSAYERVIHHVLENRRIRIDGMTYVPERMLGWYEIAFRETRTGRRQVLNLDELAESTRERRAGVGKRRAK
jgi:hypothetical protein